MTKISDGVLLLSNSHLSLRHVVKYHFTFPVMIYCRSCCGLSSSNERNAKSRSKEIFLKPHSELATAQSNNLRCHGKLWSFLKFYMVSIYFFLCKSYLYLFFQQSFTSNWPRLLSLAVDQVGLHLLEHRSRNALVTYDYESVLRCVLI